MTTAIHMKAQKRHVASWGFHPIILGVHFISQFDPHHLKRGHRDIILCFVLVFSPKFLAGNFQALPVVFM